jgi:peptidoglycan/LPS O-acetylase OafA/YrhL
MHYIPAIFALAVAAAGWYYLFYSRAAGKLAGLEAERLNRRRVRLRRLGGGMMVLMGLCFAVGFYSFDRSAPPAGFVFIWAAVLLLMAMIVVLGLVDLRLTMRLRREQWKDRE